MTGIVTSTLIGCLPVGADYLGTDHAPSPYWLEKKVVLKWSGTPTAAHLSAFEFNAGGKWGHDIYVNGYHVGTASGTRNSQSLCEGFESQQPLTWDIPLNVLLPGENTIRLAIDPSLADQSWGLSRVKIEVSGPDVNGVRYEAVSVPSHYDNNWQGYRGEGTRTQVQIPSAYNPNQPTPLLIAAHGFGSIAVDTLLDFGDAAEAKGWLLAAADYHGEVNTGYNSYFDPDDNPYDIRLRMGSGTMGARASQWDIEDITEYMIDYMQSHYNVDPTRIYLVGHSMGGMTALLTGARWADRFAAVVSDSAPTDLTEWFYDTDTDGITPNASLHLGIQTETGVYSEPYHALVMYRRPTMYPFEYQRRSPREFASNFKHLPLLLLHPSGDTKVAPHFAQDMYDAVRASDPDHAELVYYPGNHGDRIADYANYTLNWLSQYTRSDGATPSPLSFSLEWTGWHFWMGIKVASTALNEAHWVRVRQASFDRTARLIQVDAENLKPQTGDGSGSGVPPSNLAVNLTFHLAKLGLPVTGPYTVERVDLGTGAFSLTYATPVNGILETPMPSGQFMYRIVAGNQPPVYQTLVLQQGAGGYAGAQDNYLSEWAPDLNYDTASELRLYHTGAQATMKALLRFDLSQLPANATVRSAVLSVRVTTQPKNAPHIAVDAYRMNRPWAAAQATWNRPTTGQSWSAVGAEGVPGDRAETASDSRPWYQVGDLNRYGFNIVDMVRTWQNAPSSNQGVMLRATAPSTANDGALIASAEYFLVSDRPKLTIVYTLDTYTATPTATATQTATPTPTPTATTTPTATSTPTGGRITGEVFTDTDRNGQRDAGEPGRPGVLVYLEQAGNLMGTTTTGAEGAFAFHYLPAAAWTVRVNVAPGYAVTTAGGDRITVDVAQGTTTAVSFGMALAPTATPTATPGHWRIHLPLVIRQD